MSADRTDAAALPDAAWVMLDPAVEILGEQEGGYRLLCHAGLAAGMAVPPGEGLLAFVASLMGRAVQVGACRVQYDDRRLVDEMLASLHLHGFLLVMESGAASEREIGQARAELALRRQRRLRHEIAIDLDADADADDAVSAALAEAGSSDSAPVLRLRCATLAEHGPVLAELAALRRAGTLRIHHAQLRSASLACDSATRQALRRLGASVVVEGVAWQAPAPALAGLDELTRACIAVHVALTPDIAILDAAVRERLCAWAGSRVISGLCLTLDAAQLWPGAEAGDAELQQLLLAVRALELQFGDVEVDNLPGDEVLLGKAIEPPARQAGSPLAHRLRLAWLRWRLPFLKSCEGSNAWSQTPEMEEKLVRSEDDLLPNHPELLGLVPDSVVVDVCGGLGRVARRLAGPVGADGLVISIEMFRLISERARHFAVDKQVLNLQLRPGLAQRIALPDQSVDAAVNEWTGAIWELGLGPAMVAEMVRVVRRGGRVAATHRLIQTPVDSLDQPWIQYPPIYRWMREAFAHADLEIVSEKIWGQMVPSLVGDKASLWHKQYMPRLVDPYDQVFEYERTPGPRADVYLTIIAQRR